MKYIHEKIEKSIGIFWLYSNHKVLILLVVCFATIFNSVLADTLSFHFIGVVIFNVLFIIHGIKQ